MFQSPSFKCNIACFSFLVFFTVLHIFYVLIMLEGTSTLMVTSTWSSSSLSSLNLDLDSTSSGGDFTDAVVAGDTGVKKQQAQRWPPLSSLIEEKVEGNYSIANNNWTMTTANTATHRSALQLTGKHLEFIDSLLDFAIIGYPKTSTSFHIQWFSEHKEIQAFPGEVYALRDGDPAALVKQLYEEGKERKASIRGYKAPMDLQTENALDLIATYWPSAKLFVGLRNPILWFESFYNFRVRHGRNMPPPNELIGSCENNASFNVCVDNARWHVYLSRLGKTFKNHSDLGEQAKLLGIPQDHLASSRYLPLGNKIFLYDIEQLKDTNETRRDMYRYEVSRFLGLTSDLEPYLEDDPRASHHRAKFAPFDICLEEHRHLRRALLDVGQSASRWIRRYFLPNPDVVVSSPSFFEEILVRWMVDPCSSRNQTDSKSITKSSKFH